MDISKVDVSKFEDKYFKSTEKAEKKKTEEGFFEEDKKEKKPLGSEYVDNQKKVSVCVRCNAVDQLAFVSEHSLPMNVLASHMHK